MAIISPEMANANSSVSRCPEPIAIVGMGCRWPGGVRNPSQLWDLLKEKRDGWAEFSKDHINLDGFYHPNGQRPGSMYTRGGHKLQEDPRQFDHAFFGISAMEAMSMDPSQRKLLEVTYEAFESAGTPFEKFFGSRTGVFVGNFNADQQLMQFRDPDHTLPYVVTGGGPTILSNRINYVFNLQGPSLTVDTACSASMYALHLAVLSIQNGDCEQAIVAGANLILGPDGQMFTTKLGAVSPTSRCHTFDISADGYSRAEGFGALYLKKLSDALADGDPIRAVVRGTAFNANGKTGGISHPSPDGQEAVIRQAYKTAGLDTNMTGYFECHGTGTPVGDPIEVSAVGRVFASGRQDEPLLIGSIKPNLGHSESASAMSQIMKAILSMEHREIPATIGIENFNPAIDFEGARVKVVTDMTPWPSNLLLRSSINSFGYGGANSHCILDHPSVLMPGYKLHGFPLCRQITNGTNGHTNGDVNGNGNVATDEIFSMSWLRPAKLTRSANAGARPFMLLPLSAHDDHALKAYVATMSKSLNDFDLADLLYTLGCRKSSFSRRAFAIKESKALDSGINSDSVISGKTSNTHLQRIGFVFTGQGAQWPEMGAKLFDEYTVFKESIRYLDSVLGRLQRKPSWTIEEALLEPPATSRIQEPEFSQTICTALQIALLSLLRQWGIQPVVTVGHSSGEIAAAYAAGRLRASEAIVLAYFRGQVVATNQRKGLMIAVGLGPDEVEPFLTGFADDLRIAAVNSPNSVTVSGEPSAIKGLAEKLVAAEVFSRVLKTGDNAYHSHHMLALGELYETLATEGLREIETATSSEPVGIPLKWVSSVTPEKEVQSVLPAYWRQNLESPVLFSQAVQALARDVPVDLMIEIGPHPALGGPLKQIRSALQKNGLTLPICLASLLRGKHDVISMLSLAGNLFLNNAPVNLVAVNATEEKHHGIVELQHGYPCVDLPQYKFTYAEKPLYYENRLSKEYRTRKYPRHDLLGSRQPGCSRTHPSWRNVLRMKDLPWLDDHKLIPHAVLPAAAYIAMAVEAASQMHHDSENASPIRSFRLRNVAINSTLNIRDDDLGTETMLNMEKVALTNANVNSMWYKFSIGSMVPDSGIWTEHCSGTISAETQKRDIDQDQRLQADARSRTLDSRRWYEKFAEVGLGYGPTFQGLTNLQAYRGANVAAADVALDPTAGNVKGGESSYAIHPATLDTCLQLALISCHAGQVENVEKAFVPIVADSISIWVSESREQQGRGVASGELRGLRGLYARTQLYSTSGAPLLDMNELKCVTYDAGLEPSTLTREPFCRPVARVDIDTLRYESAKAMFPSGELSPSTLDTFDRFCKHVLANIKVLDRAAFEQDKTENHDKFTAWVQSWNSSLGMMAVEEEDKTPISLQGDDIVEAMCIKKLADNLDKILGGETNSIKALMEDDLLQKLYTSGISVSGAYTQLQNVVSLLAHKKPNMRILEIGAGTGGATAVVLDTLASKTAFKSFKEYVFTDSSDWYLAEAEAKFNGHTGLSFQILDIQKDPAIQGLEAHSFDLIIASGNLGQVDDLAVALSHVHDLLKPNGRLALLEVTRPRLGSEILARTMTGKWEQDRLFQSEAEWRKVLRDSGFSGIDISLDDYAGEQAISTVMLTTANETVELLSSKTYQQHDVYLVYRDYPPPLAAAIGKEMKLQGFNALYASLLSQHEIPPGSSIVTLADIENLTLLHRNDTYFKAIQALITQASTVVWVAARDAANAPGESAVMKGMLRSVSTEQVLSKIAFIELCEAHIGSLSRTAELIASKFAELQSGETVDRECVLRDGTFYVERLMSDEVLNKQFRLRHGLETEIQERSMEGQGPLRANYLQPGLLSSLYFDTDTDYYQPLKDDWVEIKTEAMGLNMKDLAVATARFDSNNLSLEAAGVVTCASSSTGLKVGDRVFGLISGNMGTYTRSHASLIAKIPDEESFASAASIPVVYLTAIYALKHLGRLMEGETVLIQSATGGLGMAAIRIAKHLGAEIYATVGTDNKRKVLVEEFGIRDDHIFDSRSLATVDEIMRSTKRLGVDVILCSSSGDSMHEMWRCIAPLGRFIDVGRVDVLGSGNLGLEVFKRNATFSSFDVGLICKQKPAVAARLMKELKQLWDWKVIGPVDHITTFDISKLESALSFFAKGVHTGKLVLTFQDPQAKLKIAKQTPRANFDPDAAYILVGSLGGLGRSLAVWMVERGARYLIFLSRSGADKPEAQLLMEELVGMGAEPDVIRCSVTDRDALLSTVENISMERPVKGVVHAAMVEGDALFDNATYSQIHAVLAPKVTGTINLHHATKDLELDFFLMTSSIVATIGTPSQGAYAAANAFQDAFARSRLAQGLPATSIGLGLILEVGSVSASVGFQQMLQRNASYGISESEFLQLLEGALCQTKSPLAKFDPHSQAQISVGFEPGRFVPYVEDDRLKDLVWHQNTRYQAVVQAISDRAATRSSSAGSNNAGSESSVQAELKKALTSAEKMTIARSAIIERLSKLVSVEADEIDADKSMARYGVDSLVAAELRNWLVKTFSGVEVTLLQLLSEATRIEDLVKAAVGEESGEEKKE